MYRTVNTISVYKCLCDYQRLRILNLLRWGPLCVCHIMEILETDQVKTSKQLRYMRELGMVLAKREAQWMVYRLAEPSHPLLTENLKCLQDCVTEEIDFARDSAKRDRLVARLEASNCCPLIEYDKSSKSLKRAKAFAGKQPPRPDGAPLLSKQEGS